MCDVVLQWLVPAHTISTALSLHHHQQHRATAHSRPMPFPCLVQYRNPWGGVRVGRLLEDLDSLAGNIAFDHW
jgi:hypothetical protein